MRHNRLLPIMAQNYEKISILQKIPENYFRIFCYDLLSIMSLMNSGRKI